MGRDAALVAWNSLLRTPAFHGTVLESKVPIAGQKIVGCGLGVFIKEAFADQEVTDPKPSLNSRIIASIAHQKSVLLRVDEIAAGNAGNGLNFVNLYGTWREGVLNPEQLAEVQALLGTSFVEHLGGYRFHRVLKEAVGAAGIAFARSVGTYRLVAEFQETGSALAVLTRESALAAPYSLAATLYRYRAPVLRLRPAEQTLLLAALSGKTDSELSAELGLSLEAAKKRWLSIFARIDQYLPEILSHADADGSGRGPQKRHRVLAYIRAHPEELRPFSWTSGRAGE